MNNNHDFIFHRMLLELFLIADILFSSRIYVLIDRAFQPFLLSAIFGIICIYAAVCVLRGNWIISTIFVVLLVLVSMQLLVFSNITKDNINPNAAFQYAEGFGFVLFYILVKKGSAGYAIERVAIYATLYTILYAVLATLYLIDYAPRSLFSGLTLDDPERGERIYMYAGAVAFAWFFWLAKTKERISIKRLLVLSSAGISLILSLSRVFELCIAVLSLLYLLNVTKSMIRALCLAIFSAVSLIFLAGILVSQVNPFFLFEGDSSGRFRELEYDIASFYISSHPLTGLGIPGTPADLANTVGDPYFASTDLGVIGVWFDFGLAGLILFLAGTYISCSYQVHEQLSRHTNDSLFLVGCYMGVYGCIAPSIFYPVGATLFSCLLGLWLAGRSIRRIRPVGLRPVPLTSS